MRKRNRNSLKKAISTVDNKLNISSCSKKLSEINDLLCKIKFATESGNHYIANELAYTVVRVSQNYLDYIGKWLSIHDNSNKTEQIDQQVLGISVIITPEGWVKACLPALLPANSKLPLWFLRRPLRKALGDYFRNYSIKNGNRVFRIPKCVMVFNHLYNRDYPAKMHFDNRNIEINGVADDFSSYVMVDDSAFECFHFYTSKPADEDGTEITVLPQRDFAAWYKVNIANQSCPENGEINTLFSNYSKKLDEGINRIKMLGKHLESIMEADKVHDFKGYLSEIVDLYRDAFKITLLIRSLPSDINMSDKAFDAFCDKQIMAMRKEYTSEGYTQYILPGILPHKDDKKLEPERAVNSSLYRTYEELKEQFEKRHCCHTYGSENIMVVQSCYGPEYNDCYYRDVDNNDAYSAIMSILPDAGNLSILYCKKFFMSQQNPVTETRICIIPTSEFGNWYEKNKPPQ